MVPVKTNQNWLPSIFNDFFENEWLAKTGVTAPAINVIENDKDYKVEMAAPGMTKDDFKVNVDENNNLTICMEKKTAKSRRGVIQSWMLLMHSNVPCILAIPAMKHTIMSTGIDWQCIVSTLHMARTMAEPQSNCLLVKRNFMRKSIGK